ncbi:hypothetical protein BGX27_004613 [Mortierella sp. AM989]|nr:hypothetical protein BGX27_004613 [Mortierella sp. AM989]
MNLLRHAVSKQKRRYIDKETGLDLDLAYITPSLIAMGFPSKSFESLYRNSMGDVEKFLDSHHEEAYKVYNLCSEKSYSDQRFHGRVAQFPFLDHSPPPFQLIHPFCEDVSDWLHTTAGNVVAVHCKAGKGRTGVMICSFLVHCGATADEAIKLYAEKRTLDGLNQDQTIYESIPRHCHVDQGLQQLRIGISDKIVLGGDVKMMLWYDSVYKRRHLCHFYFNTTFIDKNSDSLNLNKSEVDKACKDKLHSVFDKDFHISVRFSPALAQQSPLPTLDSLPNRAILLKYKNHNGPNSVQVSPPYFSSVRLSPARNKTSLAIFGMGAKESTSSSTDENNQEQTGPPSSSSGSDASCSSSNQLPTSKDGPVLVHSNKPAFKPVWSDKRRDRDDNWDTASVSSDCSESDSLLEWWYTKPPRPTIHSSAGTAAGTASASIVQPETTVRTDLETKGLIFAEAQDDSSKLEIYSLPPISPLSSQFWPALTALSGSGGSIAAPITPLPSTTTQVSSVASSSAYRSPPHSASSPLAREIRFDSLDTISKFAVKSGDSDYSGNCLHVDDSGNDSLAGSYMNEEGQPIRDNDDDDDEGRDSGIENIDYKYQDREHVRERERERERGWVDSVSRWFFPAGQQEPNGTERR